MAIWVPLTTIMSPFSHAWLNPLVLPHFSVIVFTIVSFRFVQCSTVLFALICFHFSGHSLRKLLPLSFQLPYLDICNPRNLFQCFLSFISMISNLWWSATASYWYHFHQPSVSVSCKQVKSKKASSYIAQYSVLRTVQSALHFTSLTDLFTQTPSRLLCEASN